MSPPESKPSLTPFREAIQRAYQKACLVINRDDPHHRGSDPSTTLVSYQRTFDEQLGSYERSVSFAEVMDAARRSQVVYVGDFHPMRSVKEMFLRIVQEGADPQRPCIVLLEEFPAKHNRHLKAYLQGNIDDNGLRSKAWAYDRNGSWGGVLAIVQYAKEHRKKQGIDVWGIDQRFATPSQEHMPHTGPQQLSLRERTEGMAAQVEQYLDDGKQIFVLAGELHLAPDKLPALLNGKVKSSIPIFQGPDEMFWQLFAQGLAYKGAVKTSAGAYYLTNGNPLFRAMVQNNAELPRRSDDRLGKGQLEIEYKNSLLNVLIKALGRNTNGLASIDPAQVPLRDLERLVYANDDKATVRAQLEEWVPTD